jgi:hypothetical protein
MDSLAGSEDSLTGVATWLFDSSSPMEDSRGAMCSLLERESSWVKMLVAAMPQEESMHRIGIDLKRVRQIERRRKIKQGSPCLDNERKAIDFLGEQVGVFAGAKDLGRIGAEWD